MKPVEKKGGILKQAEKFLGRTDKPIGRKVGKEELNEKPEAAKPVAAKEEVPMSRLPSIGKIVLYHGTSGEVIGPAIVSRIQAAPGVVDLHVFEPDGGCHLRTGLQNTNIGGWTWPDRREDA